jgi:hypothetical protein
MNARLNVLYKDNPMAIDFIMFCNVFFYGFFYVLTQ